MVATFKTTAVQKLVEGTTITRISTGKEARDSQGRTMYQTIIERPGQPAIINTSVNDHENHTMTHWNGVSKQAIVIHQPEPKVVSSASSTAGPVNSTNGGGAIGSENGGSLNTIAPQGRASIPMSQREKLGGKTIAGLYAEGTRMTTTFPEGAEGNDRPITVVSETWSSPELKINLLTVHNDPRTGESTTEVTDLDRAEPDPSLFQVPEGYTVKDQSAGQPQ